LPDTDVNFDPFWMYGWDASDCDGLWQIRGHLSPTTLLSHHEPSFLCLFSLFLFFLLFICVDNVWVISPPSFLVLLSFVFSLLDSQMHNLIVLQFTYFKDVEISNVFCDPS
jgi:hypothetical protein